MAATMSIAARASSALQRSAIRPSVSKRPASRVYAQDPAAPDAKVTPAEILEYARTLPGISEPFPNIFDPANFLANATSVAEVKRWRESEVTHGRVAMLAALGFIVQEQLEDFPAFVNFDGHIQGPAITQFQQVEARGAIFWEPLVFAIGLCEAYRVSLGWATPKSETFNQLKDEYNPGELGFDPLGLLPSDPKEKYDMQTKELNNGRLAMIAIAAFVGQELVEKTEIFEHLLVNTEKEIETLPQTV